MNTLAIIAAAASAQIHLGSALLVFSIQQLELEHGSQYHFALQEDVAAATAPPELQNDSRVAAQQGEP